MPPACRPGFVEEDSSREAGSYPLDKCTRVRDLAGLAVASETQQPAKWYQKGAALSTIPEKRRSAPLLFDPPMCLSAI